MLSPTITGDDEDDIVVDNMTSGGDGARGMTRAGSAAMALVATCSVPHGFSPAIGCNVDGLEHEFEDGILCGSTGKERDQEKELQRRRLSLISELMGALREARGEGEVDETPAFARTGRSRAGRSIRSVGAGEELVDLAEEDTDRFIRTNIQSYNITPGDRNSLPPMSLSLESGRQREQIVATSVREVFGDVPASTASRLAPVLADLITDRVDRSALLPATQDERANLEAMGLPTKAGGKGVIKSAMTISRLGLLSARAYIELISTNGAWGAGLINVGALSGLAALVRRWCVECQGREPGEDEEMGGEGEAGYFAGKKRKSKRGSKQKGSKKKKKSNQKRGKVVQARPETRRSQRTRKVQFIGNSDDSDFSVEEDEDWTLHEERKTPESGVMIVEETHGHTEGIDPQQQSPKEMIEGGLHLAFSIAKIPVLDEFINWSPEAREALLDAATTSMAGAAALGISESQWNVAPLCHGAVTSLSSSLQNCMRSGLNDSVEYEDLYSVAMYSQSRRRRSSFRGERSPNGRNYNGETGWKKDDKRHETAVFILRGLMPLLTYSTDLPNGQRGKAAAYDAASDALEQIVVSVSEEVGGDDDSIYTYIRPRNILNRTPRSGRRSVTPKGQRDGMDKENGVATPKTANRRGNGSRSGMGDPSPGANGASQESLFSPTQGVVPPTLKKTVTPNRGRSHTPLSGTRGLQGSHGSRLILKPPRPILSAVIGLMQKISTAKGLERAAARQRSIAALRGVLSRLPALERVHYLNFVIKLTRSKAASHRLFSVEMIGEVLPEQWLWQDHSEEWRGRVTPANGGSTNTLPSASGLTPKGAVIVGPLPAASQHCECEQTLPQALLKALQGRISDRAPAVRARAAHSLSDSLETIMPMERCKIMDSDECIEESDSAHAFQDAVMKVSAEVIITLRKRATNDDRATVRKASVHALLSLLLVKDAYECASNINTSLSQADVAIFGQLCDDPSVATRKSSADALTALLRRQYHRKSFSNLTETIESTWVDSLLPLILDAEASCAAKAVSAFASVVIEPILHVDGQPSDCQTQFKNNQYLIAWRILSYISEGANEAGATKGGTRAIKVALKKVLDEDHNMLRPLLRELHRVIIWTLGLAEANSTVKGAKTAAQMMKRSLLNSFECKVPRSSDSFVVDGRNKSMEDQKDLSMEISRHISMDDPLDASMEDPLDTTIDTGKHLSLAIPTDEQIEAQRAGAWCLLDVLTDCTSASTKGTKGVSAPPNTLTLEMAFKASSIDAAFISLSWERLYTMSCEQDTPEKHISSTFATSRLCLNVMARLGSLMSVPDARRSAENLKSLLENFDLCPDLIGTAVSALIVLTVRLYGDNDGKDITNYDSFVAPETDTYGACATWINDVLSCCERVLEAFISTNSSMAGVNLVKLERAIFTAGELSMVGFATDEDPKQKQGRKEPRPNDPVRGLLVRPSAHLGHLIQTLLPPTLPSMNSDTKRRPTPQAMRAFAFVTLGKFCLRDEICAKAALNLFVRELHQSLGNSSPSVQSNALIVLGDLCVKYTNLVDKFLSAMASYLQTGNELNDSSLISQVIMEQDDWAMVRKHAILLLASLLLQDYIKWRGLLVHRFLVACVDHDESVSYLAEATVCGPLLSKQPNLFYNNFVEAVFVLNGCSAHKIYAAAQASGDAEAGVAVGFEGVNLSGPNGKRYRHRIYRLMLMRMSDEEKIGVVARLAKEVLAGAVESEGDLSSACRKPPQTYEYPNKEVRQRIMKAVNVLSDCFAILISPCARVGRKVNNHEDEEVSNDPNDTVTASGPSVAQLNTVRGRLLSKISRKHVIETIVPILCHLKSILEASRSPLLGDLMRYMVDIFQLYRAEVKELLTGELTLLAELEYDTKKFKKQQKQQHGDVSNEEEVGETQHGNDAIATPAEVS